MLIPIFNAEKYTDNDGNYNVVFYYDSLNHNIESKVFGGYNPHEITPEINYDFLNENQANIKSILVNKIIFNNPYMGSGWYLGEDTYNLPVAIKNSKKFKGSNAILVEIFTKYNTYSYKTEYIAKVKNQEGDVYYISPNCISIEMEIIKQKLFEMEISKLFRFGKILYGEKYYF